MIENARSAIDDQGFFPETNVLSTLISAVNIKIRSIGPQHFPSGKGICNYHDGAKTVHSLDLVLNNGISVVCY